MTGMAEPKITQDTALVGIYPLPCPKCNGDLVYVVSIAFVDSKDDYCYCYTCGVSVIVSQYFLLADEELSGGTR